LAVYVQTGLLAHGPHLHTKKSRLRRNQAGMVGAGFTHKPNPARDRVGLGFENKTHLAGWVISGWVVRTLATTKRVAYLEVIIYEIHHYHHVGEAPSTPSSKDELRSYTKLSAVSPIGEAPSTPSKNELRSYAKLSAVSPIELSADSSHNGHRHSFRGSMLAEQPPPIRPSF
jgi:hypothetical protein